MVVVAPIFFFEKFQRCFRLIFFSVVVAASWSLRSSRTSPLNPGSLGRGKPQLQGSLFSYPFLLLSPPSQFFWKKNQNSILNFINIIFFFCYSKLLLPLRCLPACLVPGKRSLKISLFFPFFKNLIFHCRLLLFFF